MGYQVLGSVVIPDVENLQKCAGVIRPSEDAFRKAKSGQGIADRIDTFQMYDR